MHILYAKNTIGIVQCVPFEQNFLDKAKELAYRVAKGLNDKWNVDDVKQLTGQIIILDSDSEDGSEVIIFTNVEMNQDTFSSYFFRF